MWADGARDRAAARGCWRARARSSSGSCGCSGSRSPRSPRSLRDIEADGVDLERPRDHDLPAARRDRDRDRVRAGRRDRSTTRFEAAIRGRHADTLFSRRRRRRSTSRWRRCWSDRTVRRSRRRVVHGRADGGPADRARRAPRRTCWAASSSTPTRPRSALAGVPAELIERHGAVSPEVAEALADGARARFGADARDRHHRHRRPGRRDAGKPVGTVCLSVAAAGRADRPHVSIPGDRAVGPRPHHHDRAAPAAAAADRAAGARGVSSCRASSSPPTCRRRSRAALAAFRDAADPAVWRPVPDEALHVTLAFLGHLPEEAADAIAAVLGASRGPGAAARARRPAAAAAAPRARALRGAGRPGRALAALQRASATGLEAAGLYTPEKRAVPAARHRRPAAPRANAGRGELPAGRSSRSSSTREAVTLYRSHLGRGGARYEALHRVPVHPSA